MPDDPEPNYDDEDDKPRKRASGGSMFDRVSAPASDDKPAGNSLFSNDNAPKFSFGTNANGGSSGALFGGSAPAAAAEKPALPTPAASVSGGESEEPSDAVPPAKAESDLSKQGPGEEDEDSVLQAKTALYAIATGAPPKKEGAGVVRVLRNRVTGKGRVVVRTDAGKVLVNVGLVPDVSYVLQDNGLLRLPQFGEGGAVDKTWGIKVKEKERLRDAVDEAKRA